MTTEIIVETESHQEIITETPSVPSKPVPQSMRAAIQLAGALESRAKVASIVSTHDYEFWAKERGAARTSRKQLEEHRLFLRRPFDEALEKVMEPFKSAVEKIDTAVSIIDQKLIAWSDEQERIRKEAEQKAQEEARKRAEEEQLALAAELEASGDKETAEAIISAPVEVAPVKIQSSVPRTAQAFSRETWSGECTDLMALVKAIAAGQAPLNLVQANTVAINGLARSLKQSMKFPGVRAICNKTMASRGR